MAAPLGPPPSCATISCRPPGCTRVSVPRRISTSRMEPSAVMTGPSGNCSPSETSFMRKPGENSQPPNTRSSIPGSEFLGEAESELARIIAQHDQHVVAGVEPRIVIALVRDIATVRRDGPVAAVRPVTDVEIDQVAAVDQGKPARVTAGLAEHFVPE